MTTSLRDFFDAYASATRTSDATFLASAYADTFLFAGPAGVHAVKRDDFLRIVPKRSALFRAAGQTGANVTRLDESPLDEMHTMVRAHWSLMFEQPPAPPVVVEAETSYVLRRHDGSWQVIFQL